MGRAGTYTPLRARIGGLARSSSSDMREFSRAGAAGLMARFEREVDPAGRLPPDERARRAGAARRLHFTRLAYSSAKARRKTKTTAPDRAAVKEDFDVATIDAPTG